MTPFGFRRSTLVDASVNLVPLSIIVFFLAYFLLFDPWPPDPVALVLEIGLHVVPIVTLVVATWAAARLIQADEEGRDAS